MALRQKIETATSAVIALCALAITVSVVRAQFFPAGREPDSLRPEHEPAWRQYAVSDMRISPTTAPVTKRRVASNALAMDAIDDGLALRLSRGAPEGDEHEVARPPAAHPRRIGHDVRGRGEAVP